MSVTGTQVGGGGQLLRGDHQTRPGDLEAAPSLGWRQPVVHPGGDGSDLGRRHVGHGVGGTRRQEQSDQVADPDAASGQAGGDGVRQAVELGVREGATVGGHVHGGVAEAGGRLSHDAPQKRSARHLRPSSQVVASGVTGHGGSR